MKYYYEQIMRIAIAAKDFIDANQGSLAAAREWTDYDTVVELEMAVDDYFGLEPLE